VLSCVELVFRLRRGADKGGAQVNTKRGLPVSTEYRAPESTASRAREIGRAWGISQARSIISNRHPCRLETRINPSASMTSLFLIVTKLATRKASPSRANPPWRMSRGTCFAPAAFASPRLCSDSHFTRHSLALRIAFRTNGPLTCTEPAAAGERVTRLPRARRRRAKGHCISNRQSNRGASKLESTLSPAESSAKKFLTVTFCHSLKPQSPLLRTRHRAPSTDHESRFPSLPLASALGIVF
jgi:hypothetical protein